MFSCPIYISQYTSIGVPVRLIGHMDIHFGGVYQEENVRLEISGFLRPHETLLHLNGHLLDRPRTKPSSWSRNDGTGFIFLNLLLLDVRSDGDNTDVVGVVEIVFYVEFIKRQWYDECRKVGW